MAIEYWNTQGLQNKFQEISERADRISMEFDLGGPDIDACDQLLRSLWSDIGDILQTRKREGWPT